MSEPLLYLISFGYGISPMVGHVRVGTAEVRYLAFIAPAMVCVGVLFQAFFEGAYGSYIRLRFQRTWQALLTGPLGYNEVFFGDWLWAATRGMIAAAATGTLTVVLGLISVQSLLLSLPLLLLGSLMSAGAGMAVAGLVRTVDQINVPVFVFIIPMFTLSGTFFPRENLPAWLARYAVALPLASFVDLMRWPLFTPHLWPVKLAALFAWLFVCTGIAWRVIRAQVFR